MRVFFGIIIGIAITLGAAFFHDNNVPPDERPLVAERQIVNWEVLGMLVREQVANARDLWNRTFGN